MRIDNLGAAASYGASRVQKEALVARNTQDVEAQVRIAENSNNRLVLLSLALNNNLESEAIDALYDRDISYLTKRLDNLGYKKQSWLGKVF